MNPFAGKSPTERNKIIAAMVLGFVALGALYLSFGRGLFSGSTTTAVTVKPSPGPMASNAANTRRLEVPSQAEQNTVMATTPIVYNPGDYSAPEPGRNIFAFYEPPKPCLDCPPPVTPVKTPPTPTPTPPPPMTLAFVTPQTIYAGSGSFRLEANGDKFDPSARIYFNQSELPTQFVSSQKLVANVPSSMIAGEGSKSIIIQTPDGKLYSEQLMINVQPPPKPQFTYIGMIARARHNNDTAYFMEPGKQVPTGARLGDPVGGRFRLISISSAETVFEDVNLGFKHRVPLTKTSAAAAGGDDRGRPPFRGGGFQPDPNNVYVPYNPNVNPNVQDIPGIPSNIPRAPMPNVNTNPNNPNVRQPTKKDEDDGDGGGR